MDENVRSLQAVWFIADAAPELFQLALQVREAVFVQEQKVSLERERDAEDALAKHLLVFDGEGALLATARLYWKSGDTQTVFFGRMAVLQKQRGLGIGRYLLEQIREYARRLGAKELRCAAQTHALGFYETHGFQAEGEEFFDAGIAHFEMRSSL